MNIKLFNGLMVGRKYEEVVASWFEEEEVEVWKIGNWRLPIDLVVWASPPLFIEVKFRSTGKRPEINMDKLRKFMDNRRAFLVTIGPDSVDIVMFKTISYKKYIENWPFSWFPPKGRKLVIARRWTNKEGFLDEILVRKKGTSL